MSCDVGHILCRDTHYILSALPFSFSSSEVPVRRPVNKHKSANRFERRGGKTHPINQMNPRRGGIRL